MPFVQYLGFLGKYSLELGGYTGTYSLRQESTTFVLPDASISILPIVCFESIFGPYCSRNLPEEKGFICMITNDGWWKKATLKGKIHLRHGQTFFARHGDYLGRISLVLGGFLVLYGGIRKLKK
jgi:apolipoprotein N-acyltransferase